MSSKVLDACLNDEHRRAGLYLEEDEDILYLKRAGRVLAVFSAKRATVASIGEEAEKHIERENDR